MVVRVLLIFKVESTIADMVEIFQPLKEGYSDTTSIAVQIRNNKNIILMEDPFSFLCDWSVGSLCYDLCFNLPFSKQAQGINLYWVQLKPLPRTAYMHYHMMSLR